MTSTETKAGHVFDVVRMFWPLAAEVPHPTPLEAVKAGREVAGILYDATIEAGLELKQAACWLVFANKADHPLAVRLIATESSEARDAEFARRVVTDELEPIGIVVGLIDRELGGILSHGRGFRNDERTQRLLTGFFNLINQMFAKRDVSEMN